MQWEDDVDVVSGVSTDVLRAWWARRTAGIRRWWKIRQAIRLLREQQRLGITDLVGRQLAVEARLLATITTNEKVAAHLRELHADMQAWLGELTPAEKARLAEAVRKRHSRAEKEAKAAEPQWPAREDLPRADVP